MTTDVLFSLPVTVNYEDTDAGGVVYYANYLAYMERARNAYLRAQGLPLTVVKDEHQVIFVVTEAHLRYHKPAVLDDEIDVTLKIGALGGASATFIHQVMRGGERLVEGQVQLAIVHAETLSPCRMPDIVRRALDR